MTLSRRISTWLGLASSVGAIALLVAAIVPAPALATTTFDDIQPNDTDIATLLGDYAGDAQTSRAIANVLKTLAPDNPAPAVLDGDRIAMSISGADNYGPHAIVLGDYGGAIALTMEGSTPVHVDNKGMVFLSTLTILEIGDDRTLAISDINTSALIQETVSPALGVIESVRIIVQDVSIQPTIIGAGIFKFKPVAAGDNFSTLDRIAA